MSCVEASVISSVALKEPTAKPTVILSFARFLPIVLLKLKGHRETWKFELIAFVSQAQTHTSQLMLPRRYFEFRQCWM